MSLLAPLRVSPGTQRCGTFLPFLWRNHCWCCATSRHSPARSLSTAVVSFHSPHPKYPTKQKKEHAKLILEFLHEKIALDKQGDKGLQIAMRVPTKFDQQELGKLLDGIQKELQCTQSDLKGMIEKFPQLLGQDLVETMEKFKWLQTQLSLSDVELKKLVQRLPQLFAYAKDENLEKTLQWLQNKLQLNSQDQLKQFVLRLPQVLGLSIENNLAPTFHFYEKHLGEEKAIKWVSTDPSLLGYSLINRLEVRFEVAQKLGMNLDDELMRKIAKCPEKEWEPFTQGYPERSQKALHLGMTLDDDLVRKIAKYPEQEWEAFVQSFSERLEEARGLKMKLDDELKNKAAKLSKKQWETFATKTKGRL